MSVAEDIEIVRRAAAACFGAAATVEGVPGGSRSVFRCRLPSGTHVIKLAPAGDAAGLRKEAGVLDLLGRRGLPVPRVVRHDDGGLVGRPFLALTSAGERTLGDWLEHPGARAAALFTEMGGVLARIHGVRPHASERAAAGLGPRAAGDGPERAYALAERAVALGILDAAYVARFRALPVPPLAGDSLCHGDFHSVQCVEDGGRLTAVVDWESARLESPWVDLAIALTYFDFYCPPQRLQCFLAGYAAERPLPPDYESAYLPVRMAQALALAFAWHQRGRPELGTRALDLFCSYARRA